MLLITGAVQELTSKQFWHFCFSGSKATQLVTGGKNSSYTTSDAYQHTQSWFLRLLTLPPPLFKEPRCELQNDAPFSTVTSTKLMCSETQWCVSREGGAFWSEKKKTQTHQLQAQAIATGKKVKSSWIIAKYSLSLLKDKKRNITFKSSTLKTNHTNFIYLAVLYHNMDFCPFHYFFLTNFITGNVFPLG